jgi:RNA 2',3'-cyclic 3'-phosphodiesterase
LRAFLALEVAEESLIQNLANAQEEMRRTQADLAIVEKQNLHFTVKFLGEISEARIPEINSRLGPLKLRSAPLSIRGIGVFPDISRPRVVWTGVPQEERELIVPLAEAVIRALDGIGERDDREYHPHITLARVRSGRNREKLASFISLNAAREFGKAHLVALKLKSSTLTPRGPIYNDVREYRLE